FWTPAEATQPALYGYKIMISPERRGTGLGDALLDWMCERAEQVGAKWLRIDCWKTNTQLHSYFERRGFEHYDTRTAPGRNSGWLAQRDVQVRTAPSDLAIRLVDDTVPAWATFAAKPADASLYDPHGQAAIWEQAAEELRHADLSHLTTTQVRYAVDITLNQISLRFARYASEQRQANGTYYRVLDGRRSA